MFIIRYLPVSSPNISEELIQCTPNLDPIGVDLHVLGASLLSLQVDMLTAGEGGPLGWKSIFFESISSGEAVYLLFSGY